MAQLIAEPQRHGDTEGKGNEAKVSKRKGFTGLDDELRK
jgi:hypothetical protein